MNKVYIESDANLNRLECEKVMQAPLAEQRFKFYGHMIYGYSDISRMETDTHVYWANCTHIPKWNPKTGIYFRNDSTGGCSYDKKTKKFKFWYGKQVMFLSDDIYKNMCEYFGAEWFINEPQGLKISTTNSVFAKVLLGKITDKDELIKAIVKANPVLRNYNLDISKLRTYIESASHNRIQGIADYVDVAKDINVVLDVLSNPNNNLSWLISDLIAYARMLNRKIDFSWDSETQKAMHTKWQEEIEVIKQEWMPLLSF